VSAVVDIVNSSSENVNVKLGGKYHFQSDLTIKSKFRDENQKLSEELTANFRQNS
jgi:hypothetical protein